MVSSLAFSRKFKDKNAVMDANEQSLMESYGSELCQRDVSLSAHGALLSCDTECANGKETSAHGLKFRFRHSKKEPKKQTSQNASGIESDWEGMSDLEVQDEEGQEGENILPVVHSGETDVGEPSKRRGLGEASFIKMEKRLTVW